MKITVQGLEHFQILTYYFTTVLHNFTLFFTSVFTPIFLVIFIPSLESNLPEIEEKTKEKKLYL